MKRQTIESAYKLARERYAALGVNTDTVLQAARQSARFPPLLAGR